MNLNRQFVLATLRLDGFVSVNAGSDASAKPLGFFGDALEINANAEGGWLSV